MAFSAVARIRSTALRHNLQRVHEAAPGCPVLAVIKADAYGHGLVATARALSAADAFGVARFAAALELRQAGIDKDIVVLSGWLDAESLALARDHNLQVVVHDEEQVATLATAVTGESVRVWLKIDSGMGRLGIAPANTAETIDRLRDSSAVADDLCLMTHLSCADETQRNVTGDQLRLFGEVIGNWIGDISIANSAGVLGWPETVAPGSLVSYFGRNWVRPGLMLYGVSPLNSRTALECGLEPAMLLEGRLLVVRDLHEGGTVGYGAEWRATRDSRIGVINVGYADGYPWRLSNRAMVQVADVNVPVIGRVSMDMISVDLTEVPSARPGDVVTLWGCNQTVEELAGKAGMSSYELLTGVGARIVRQHE
ncbi:MAG: alanine racemase [Gammaproteobacteria bacterium]|nr:alanine racemase [Chromatiales bacterium]MDP6675149.1 alanine racemase [Gammaproteobacteria bacterium]